MKSQAVSSSRALMMVSQGAIVESRHRIATAAMAVSCGLYLATRRRALRGGSDEPCRHPDAVEFRTHGTYDEACAERETAIKDLNGYHVSAVQLLTGGEWGWLVCLTCRH